MTVLLRAMAMPNTSLAAEDLDAISGPQVCGTRMEAAAPGETSNASMYGD